MAFTGAGGLILGFPTLRLRGDYLAIVTLDFGEIIRLMADNLADITNGPRGLKRGRVSGWGRARDFPRRVLQRELLGRRHYGTWWFWLVWCSSSSFLLLVGQPRTQPGGPAWWRSATTRTPRKLWVSTHSGSSYGRS